MIAFSIAVSKATLMMAQKIKKKKSKLGIHRYTSSKSR